ncbi:hypothetical protein AAG906_039038 [Vitis piasezkii]
MNPKSLTKQLQESEEKKKKNIALKATTKDEEDVEEEKPSEEDDDLALITRKLNKYMRGERFRRKKFTSRRNPQEGILITCEESSEEEKEKEVANMCFMAIDDLDEVQGWRSGKLYHDAPPVTTPSCTEDVMIALSLLRNLHYKGQLSTAEPFFTIEHYKNPIIIEHGEDIVSSLTNSFFLSLSL